jgi:hypothetical protein
MLSQLNVNPARIELAAFVPSMDLVVLSPPLFCPPGTEKTPRWHWRFLSFTQFARNVKKVIKEYSAGIQTAIAVL